MNEKITCALFGHRKMPPWVARELERTIDFLIGERGVRRFLVAGQGEFDRAAARSLARRMRENPSLDAACAPGAPPAPDAEEAVARRPSNDIPASFRKYP